MNGFIPCWDCKSWASQREGHTTGKNKNLNLGLPGSRHALNLVNEWISEWVQGSSIVTWVHLFIFMTQRIGKKSILSRMLPPQSIFRVGFLTELETPPEDVERMLICAKCLLWIVFSSLSHTDGELPNRCRYMSVTYPQRGIYNGFIRSFFQEVIKDLLCTMYHSNLFRNK